MKCSFSFANIMFCIAVIISTSTHAMETTTSTETITQPQRGISGWLYTQSWLLEKPQLVLYAFKYSLFEPNNDVLEAKTSISNLLTFYATKK